MRQEKTNSKRVVKLIHREVPGALVHNVPQRQRTMLYPGGAAPSVS